MGLHHEKKDNPTCRNLRKPFLFFSFYLFVFILAAGTVVERFRGHAAASDMVYGAWWFCLLLAGVGIAAVVATVKLRLWHSPHRLLTALSVPFILLGGALTFWTGQHGRVTLQPGEAVSSFTTENGDTKTLPFALTLDRFEVVNYPGTQAPMDFVSHVTVEGQPADISMNHILRKGGYRFYQEDYDAEGNSTLSVAHDPTGIAITYAGYLLLLLGLGGMMLSPNGRFRQLLRKAVPVLLFLMLNSAYAAPPTLPRETADQMGRMYVLYKGRMCPLQTLAKDFSTKLYGKATYQGLTAEQVLAGWVFYFDDWSQEPMIKIKGGDIRQQLGMTGAYTSFNNLSAHQALFECHPMPSALRAAHEKYNLVRMLYSGQMLKIYPIADDDGAVGWYSQSDDLPLGVGDDEYLFVRKQLGYCQELVVTGDLETLSTVFEKTRQFQQRQAAGILPSEGRFNAERLYNALTTGRWLAMLCIALGLFTFALALYSHNRSGRLAHLNHGISLVLVALLTLFLLTIFVLRWVAGGHAPMAGGFDSMHLMAVVIGGIALLASRKYRLAPSIALPAMGFCLLVAMMSGSNPPITNLMPVLASPLLTLHVTVIMMAYALFLFVMLNGAAGLILRTHAERLRRISLLLLYPAVALLATGIIIGAVWANVSWGCYWSWDPKEVWALVTLLIYLVPLTDGTMRPARFHLYCLLAFLSVIVTYFGVNLLLGGMHAYA